jgi:Ni/Co efflux regulator RcnB
MKRYTGSFRGRPLGAIGITFRCSQVVTAADDAAARLALYATHQDISDLRWTRIERIAPEEVSTIADSTRNHLAIVRIDTRGAWRDGRTINQATRDALAYCAAWPNRSLPDQARQREYRHNGDHVLVTVSEQPA